VIGRTSERWTGRASRGKMGDDMHELSIASSILSTVESESRRLGLGRVHAVVVRVGALSGVVPDALQFSFEAIRIDTPFAETRLEIEWREVRARCADCDREFEVKDLRFACPGCESTSIEVTSGNELEIAHLEVEDD
jgi:hydrogenase nickel incorporation protein HypA/HybF